MPLNIFNIKNPIIIDSGIMRYEYRGYEPKAHINLNTLSEIRIHVTHKDISSSSRYFSID